MARPQEFDTGQALRSAMLVFWSKGYEAASLTDILAATGLSKSSLYATFGDKRSLFLAAFEAFRTERLAHVYRILDDGPARQSIERLLREAVAHAAGLAELCGSMTTNQAVELAPHDIDVRKLVDEDFQAIEDAFVRAIERGQAEGSIASREQPRRLARFLVVGLGGLEVMARAKSGPARLEDAVSQMMAAFD